MAGTDADLVVIGAGPAGASTALLAARSGRRVVLLDRGQFPRDKPCGEGLLPSGIPALRALDLHDQIVSDGAPPLNGVQFGLAGQPHVEVPFPAHGGVQAGLGVRRLTFDQQLVESVRRDDRIRLCENMPASRLLTDKVGVVVATPGGEIRSPRAVAADGLRSSIRHQLGWTVGPRPPHRYGIISHWNVSAPIDPWIRITFTDGLELYEGPVAGGQRMVGLLCYQERMREFAGRLKAHYCQTVLALRPALRDADQVGPVHAVGPFRYRSRRVAGRGVFLVGDAAGFTDPITGEGIAASLRQAQALVASLDAPEPESSYRRAHRRLTTDPRRIASLFLRLSRTPALVERGIRSHEQAPQMLSKLLGVEFGYWGFNRITPREWVRLFSGR